MKCLICGKPIGSKTCKMIDHPLTAREVARAAARIGPPPPAISPDLMANLSPETQKEVERVMATL